MLKVLNVDNALGEAVFAFLKEGLNRVVVLGGFLLVISVLKKIVLVLGGFFEGAV